MFQHPLHKRIISRAVFYSGVFLYLWLVDLSEGEKQTAPSLSAHAASVPDAN